MRSIECKELLSPFTNQDTNDDSGNIFSCCFKARFCINSVFEMIAESICFEYLNWSNADFGAHVLRPYYLFE